ncbi:MAG: PAS domain S-box protein [Chloroflexota bacterium]|nr:PAS domain S-box protein [Chloroflexota bacterium]
MRKRTLITIGATFASLVLMLYFISRIILMESFTELEERYVRRDVERAQSALSNELAALDTLLFDWAAWDDTYTFIKDVDEKYIESNLVDETFTGYRLNLILFVNSSGQIVFGKGFDLYSDEEMPVSPSLQEHLTKAALLRHPDVESSITGIVLLSEGPLLIASRPILTSEEEGPIRGTMLMGRYLTPREVERLAQAFHISLDIYRFDDAWMPSDFRAAYSSLSAATSSPQEASVFIQPLSAESIAGYTLLKDIYGEPALVLGVDMPRDIYQRGQTSMLYLIFLLLFGGMASTGMASWMVDKILISRLVRLNADVNSIGASGDLEERVSTTGSDELSSLVNGINGMLAALKQSHNALRESEKRYRLLFNSANDIIFVSTVTEDGMPGRIIEVNDIAYRTLGYTREELLQLSPLDIAAPESWDDFAILAAQFLTEKQIVFEAIGVNKDGTKISVEVSAHLFELDGQPAVLSIARDITKRKQAEEALRESEQRFRDVARSTGDWIWEVDAEGRYTYASTVVEQVIGYTPEEVMGKSLYGLVLNIDGYKELGARVREARRKQEPFLRLVNPNAHKDGHTVILETTGLPLTDMEGNLLGYRGVHRDITAERRLEEKLGMVHALGRALVLSRDEQQIAQATVDTSRFLLQNQLCGLWLVDEENQSLNRRACTATALTADITTLPLDGEQGVTLSVALNGTPIYLPDVQESPHYIDSGIETRSELCVPLKVEERVIGALNVESKKTDAFDESDQQLLSTLADQAALAIESARLYERMRAARDRLQALSHQLVKVQEAERRHIARELHDEIGQILTGLKIVVEMSMTLPVDEMKASLTEALTLVNELVTRVRGLSLDLRPTTLDDLGLAPALRWHFERYTSQTNVRVTFKHTGVEGRRFAPEIETAAYRIAQEALTNVARHSGVNEVTARLWADRETLGVQIQDQGVGFEAGDESILASSGLSGMCERAALLGGQLTIESAPGRGARLTAEFPLAPSSTAAADEPGGEREEE